MAAVSHPGRAGELGRFALLLVLALLLRLPHLHTIPRYTDETGEVSTAIAIAFEGERPLVHNDAYRGPAWAYGLAGLLRALGPRPGLPRLYALAIGLLTVAAVYLLGRLVSGPRAAWIAGLLQATAFAPIVLESHVAWSNHATPLAVTLAAIATRLGSASSGRRADAWLLLAGLAWGLALQTHPSVIAPLAGAALWLVATPGRRSRLRRPAPWLALGLFILALSPLLLHNLERYRDAGSLSSLEDATAESQPINRELSPAVLARNLAGLAGQLGRAAAAGRPVEPGEPVPGALAALTDALRPLATLALAVLLLAALVRAALRGPTLLAAMAWSGIAVLPLVNRNYQSFYDMRYLGFLLPLAFVALAGWLADLAGAGGEVEASSGSGATPGGWPLDSARGSRGGVLDSIRDRALRGRSSLGTSGGQALLIFGLSAYALLNVAAYYQREEAAGRSNADMIVAADRLAREMAAPEGAGSTAGTPAQIWIDKAMRPIKLEGGGDPVRAFDQLLFLRSVPAELSDADELRWFLVNDNRSRYWILAADGTAEALGAEGFSLQPMQVSRGWQLLLRDPVP